MHEKAFNPGNVTAVDMKYVSFFIACNVHAVR